MDRIVSVTAALQCALTTLNEQPREVPAAPAGWAVKAQAALDGADSDQILVCAGEILSAHAQYRAEFDVKGWLFDLRNAVRQAPAHAAAAVALAGVVARGLAAKPEQTDELPALDFEGTLVRPKNGKYKCPYRCQTSGFPAQSWKTVAGFKRHMEACTCSPSARQRKAANDAFVAADAQGKCEAAAKELGLKVGDQIFYTGYMVTRPTHQPRHGRLVRMRYEEERQYFGAAAIVQSFGWTGALVINGRIAMPDLCTSLAEAQEKAKTAQLQYDSHVELSAACR